MRFLGLLLFTVGSFRSFDFLFLFRFLWHISPMLCHTINFHPNKSIENELIAADVAMQRKCAEAAMVMGKMEKKESIVALFKRNLTTWWPIYSFATVYLCVEIETSARHRYVHYFTAHDRHIANVTDKQTSNMFCFQLTDCLTSRRRRISMNHLYLSMACVWWHESCKFQE